MAIGETISQRHRKGPPHGWTDHGQHLSKDFQAMAASSFFHRLARGTLLPNVASLLIVMVAWSTVAFTQPDGPVDTFSFSSIRWKTGDNPEWANPGFDDSNWQGLDVGGIDQVSEILWIRAHLVMEPKARTEAFAYELHLDMLASYEIYFDGRLSGRSGRAGASKAEEIPGPYVNIFPIPDSVLERGQAIIALRLSSQHRYLPGASHFDPLHRLASNALIQRIAFYPATMANRRLALDDLLQILVLTVHLVMAFYFFFIFLGNRQEKTTLAFSLLCFFIFTLALADAFQWAIGYPYSWHLYQWWAIAISVAGILLLLPLCFLYKFRLRRKRFWLLGFLITGLLTAAFAPEIGVLQQGEQILMETLLLTLAIHFAAWRKGESGVWATAIAMVFGAACFLFKTSYFFVFTAVLMVLVLRQLARAQQVQRRQFHDSKLQASKLEAELLRKNIQPHFLMNSLTSALELLEVDPEEGAKFVEALGEEFRILNQIADQTLIPLEKELALCRLHLQIMGYRFKKTFVLETHNLVEPDMVPPAIFHTLVENAITHNRFESDTVHFQLTSEAEGPWRRYVFNGPLGPAPKRSRETTGTGTRYIQTQLERAFTGRWQFKSQAKDQAWITIIHIPIDRGAC